MRAPRADLSPSSSPRHPNARRLTARGEPGGAAAGLHPSGLLALAAALLAACGGSGPEPATDAMAASMVQATNDTPRRALALAAPAAAAAAATPSAEQLFDWAEYRYPALFPPAIGSANFGYTYGGQAYTVRSWGNGNHLGLTPDGRIYGLGPFTGQVLTAFGQAADYAAMVTADLCRAAPESCFTTGTARTLAVSAARGGEVRDTASGLRLLFADGGSGQLTLTPLTATPPPPVPGSGWRIAYTGTQQAEVVLEGSFDGKTAWPAAYVYDELPPGAVDDALGLGPRWIPLPVRQLAPGRWAFELWPTGGTAAAAGARRGILAAPNTEARRYYIGQFEKGSTDTDKRIGLHGLSSVYADDFIGTLPAPLATQVRARRAEKFLSWGEDGNYYRGFTYQPNRRLYPIISITLDGFSLAHETGHYLTHLLVGHDAYERLHAQPYPKEHGIRIEVGRGSVNEDYAYFIESFLKGTGGQYDLAHASGSYLRDRPAGADVPAIEGFTAAMLAAAVRTTTSIPSIDLKNKTVDVPVVGLGHGRVFELLAGGPQNVEAVRRALEAGLDADGQRRLLVNLQRLGWRYSATLRVVDAAGNPVPNAPARLLVRAGGSEYTGDVGTTDAGGNLNLWFAFPGSSALVVTRAGETLEGTVTIDPSRSTQQRQTLGDVRVQAQQTWSALREVCASFSYTTITQQTRIEDGPFTRVECVTVPSHATLTWTGGSFVAIAGTTYVEGVISPDGRQVNGVKAHRPHTGRYKTPPPPFQILIDQMPRDLASLRIRYRLEGLATTGKVQIQYQPEDECFGSFCEARAIKAVDMASVSVWATFDE